MDGLFNMIALLDINNNSFRVGQALTEGDAIDR